MTGVRVPLFDVRLSAAEKAAVLETLDQGWLTLGPRTARVEQLMARQLGVAEVVAVASGTAALHLSLQALGVGPGDEVIVPALTFVATANAVRYVGARPVFCDICGPQDLNLDPDDVEQRIGPATRAIIAVHYAGYPADLARLQAIADRHRLILIEDAAHAYGTRVQGRSCGSWGDCGCFSFFSNKNITCGEGGAIATGDAALAARLRRLRAHGLTSTSRERFEGLAYSYDVEGLGWNYRIDEMRSALLAVQLERLDGFLERRRALVEHYRARLAGLSLQLPEFGWARRSEAGDRMAHHIFPLLLPPGTDRAAVMRRMREDGVETSIHYPPVHRLSAYRDVVGAAVSLPRVEAVAARELTLPLFPDMTDEQQLLACRSLRRALETVAV